MQDRKGAGRGQVLSTAKRLFTNRGAANVGINEVTAEAGVARMTLYNNFPSKEALIAEVYREVSASILLQLAEVTAVKVEEEAKILSLFDHIETQQEGFRGCPMIHASLQSATVGGDIYTLVQDYKHKLREFIFELLDEKRVSRGELADQILLLLDGAAIEFYLKGVTSSVTSAKLAVIVLLRNTP